MTRTRHSTRWLVVALMALLTASHARAADLVLCLGSDGHRALELEHPGTSCPTLEGEAAGTAAISVTPVAETLATCLDLPAVGSADGAFLCADSDRVPTPALALLAPAPAPAPRAATHRAAPPPARAGPPSLARHLRSTVLLV